MARSRTRSVFTRRVEQGDDGGLTVTGREPDDLVVEEPMTIRLDDNPVSSTMRTPGHDFELAAGFLLSEGVVEADMITGIRYCGTGSATDSEFNVVSVETGGRADVPTARMGAISSSCGLCGSDAIEEMTERLRVLPSYQPWPLELLAGLPQRLRSAQPLFDSTGAVHAAGSFDRGGQLVLAREDIGRHNAVDKVVGRLMLDRRLPAPGTDRDMALVVSGRSSFEMVQKAWAAGFSALVSVSAPSALAVAMARRAGITLVGFARPDRAKVYSPDSVL